MLAIFCVILVELFLSNGILYLIPTVFSQEKQSWGKDHGTMLLPWLPGHFINTII